MAEENTERVYPRLIIDGDTWLYRAAVSSSTPFEAIQKFDHYMDKLFNVVESTWGAAIDEIDYYLFIQVIGGSNFRTKFPGPNKYKANRGPKPELYPVVHKHACERFGAYQVDLAESDDACCIMAKLCNHLGIMCVVASEDKDCLCIETPILKKGKLIKSGSPFYFWQQMLTGDTTDSIPGVPGIGIRSAEKIFEEIHTEEDAERIILGSYKNKYGRIKGFEFYRWNFIMLRLLDNFWDQSLPVVTRIGEHHPDARFFNIKNDYLYQP